MRRSLALAAASSVAAQSSSKPQDVAMRAISKLVSIPFDQNLWSWSYGPAIQMSAMWEVTEQFGQNWTTALNTRLDQFIKNSSYPAYKVLNNISMPWDAAIGDNIGLMPIAFLSRLQYYGNGPDSVDWQVAMDIADQYVAGWPRRLPDGTISRDDGWTGEPDVNASFLWSDDQFMGTTLLARLARTPYVPAAKVAAWADFLAHQQVQFANYMQEPTNGLYYHGYDHAVTNGWSPAGVGTVSCCFWGRANGWIMMSHAEIVTTLSQVAPGHPLLPVIIDIWRRQAAGLAAVQDAADGRWHQVVNETSTYLETSVTGMTLYSMATGVLGGWLDKESLDPVIRQAWAGLAQTVGPDGTVSGICTGTGVGTTVAFYQARPTDYLTSAPGLGSVFRAALAYDKYISAFGE